MAIQYGQGQYDYMAARPADRITENDAVSPPCLVIVDEAGIRWTLGALDYPKRAPNGHFAFMVLANGFPTGEIASHIERKGGKIRIWTIDGWKRWTGVSFI